MSTLINYKVTKLWASPNPINEFNDVVVNVYFDIIATDTETGAVGLYHGIANLESPEENQENFIPYDQLAEEQLVNWIKLKYGVEATLLWEQQAISQTTVNVPKTAVPW